VLPGDDRGFNSEGKSMTATQTEFTATEAGLPVASQKPSLTVGPSALDRLLARGRIRGALAMLGPAFVASVAYVDPGNFATNMQGGAQYGYLLLWVVLAANLMAMVVQYLSAKLGIVTGRALPELVRDRLPRPATWGMWVQGEVVAMATDVAEFIGAALGLNLLFGVPMLSAGLITGLITFAVLGLRTRGRRRFELAIIALLGFVVAGFLYETLRLGPSVPGSLHGLVPGLDGAGSLYLAVGILGATVMPHVIYLHSAMTKTARPAATTTTAAACSGSSNWTCLRPWAWLTSRRDVMGCHVNQRRTTIAGGICVAVIIALNILLLWQQFFQS
jgi:manganese transport protein